jgi:hypothetical protein
MNARSLRTQAVAHLVATVRSLGSPRASRSIKPERTVG